MSLLFATGFGLTTTVLDLFEADVGSNAIGAFGRNTGAGLQTAGNDNRYVRKNLGGSVGTVIVGVAVKPVTLTNTSYVLTFWDNGTAQASIRIQTDGVCVVTGTATTFNLPLGVYSYLEAKLVVHNTTGSWVIRVNGTEVLNVTGINTRAGTGNNSVSQVSLGGPGSGSQTTQRHFDDLYILSNQGLELNDFLGDVRIDALFPTGAGDSTQWTPSAGANWENVDESPPDGDTTYNSSATVGQKDLYAFDDLPSPSGAVKAVIATVYARKDDAGTRTIKSVVKHGGVEADGADHGLSTDYAYYQDAFATNPSTTDPWTIAEVNAMQAGIEVVA